MSLFWADWPRAAATRAPRRPSKARSVILIFNCGAPSHLDIWGPKPDAPESARGPYRPVATAVPGVRVSTLAAARAAREPVRHRHSGHNSGMYWSVVGRPYPVDSALINPGHGDYPSFGTLVGWLTRRDGYSGTLPSYVITPAPHCESTAYVAPGQFGGCLGKKYDTFVLNSDPNAPDFQVPNLSLAPDMTGRRFEEPRALLGRLDDRVPHVEAPAVGDFETYQARAFSLVTSPEVRRAFDLSRESAAVRERYGRHSWGQSHLLARRLVEAGVRFVTPVNGPSIVWDTHKDNVRRLNRCSDERDAAKQAFKLSKSAES